MSDEHCQQASMVPSTGPPPEKKPFAAFDQDYEGNNQQEVRNNRGRLSAAEPSKSTPSLETDEPFFSPWTWNFPDAIASTSTSPSTSTSTSTQETKPRIVIEEGSYFHIDLHKLVAFSKILTRMEEEKQLGKDSEKR